MDTQIPLPSGFSASQCTWSVSNAENSARVEAELSVAGISCNHMMPIEL
ncbi:hypothetical protein WL883_25780 [Escherichia coli]